VAETTLEAATVAKLPPSAPGPFGSRLRGVMGGSGTTWLLALPIALVVLLLIVPLGYLTYEAINGGGFSDALSDELFRKSVVRTLLLAATVTVLTMIFGTLYALALAVSPRGVAVVLLVFLFTVFWTSLLVRTYGWMLLYLPQGPIYSVLHGLGLREQPIDIFQKTPAAYPAMVHVMLPYVVLPVYSALRQIDPQLIRAARTLGAKPPLILRKVILPQTRAGLTAGGVLVFITSLGFYVTPQLLGDPRARMVASMIGDRFGVPGETSSAAAMSVLLVLVAIVIYIVADRLFKVSEQWGRS
jgi:putative spermidine/putrescine transport system permease protein